MFTGSGASGRAAIGMAVRRFARVPLAGMGLATGMFLLVGGLAGGSVPAIAGEQVIVDGVLHVKNGAAPSQGSETIRVDEQWRVGGEEGDVLLGLVSQVEIGQDGNIYLLDTQLAHVEVFSPDGQHLRTLSREGEGPGEVRIPLDVLFMPDGSVGLVQTFPGKIVKVSLEGVPAGEVTFGGADPGQTGLIALLDGMSGGGNLVLGGMSVSQVPPAGQKRTSFIASFTPEGREQARYFERTIELDFSSLVTSEKATHFPAPRRWTMGADGRVYIPTERDEYTINVYAPDGKIERVIEREFACPKRSPERLALFQTAAAAQAKQLPGNARIDISDSEPAVSYLRAAPDGSLWVLNGGSTFGQPEGIMETFDVFDAQGNFTKQVAVACPGDGENDGLFFVGSDRLVLVTGLVQAAIAMQGGLGAAADEEAAPMEVVCYRIRS